ncbi:MAG TPA: bifunctional UDP-sugar hydrolase/5'-nucleotidase [Myxococcota bacterium]|nr:bifunctional UDP-sugar hydrolase/5'-nucleotidase [Myxococcota bacterium]
MKASTLSLSLFGLAGCTSLIPTESTWDVPALSGQDVRLTIIHTSDIHSRLLPYQFDPSFTDNGLGLSDGAGDYGGLARMAYVIKRERQNAGRSLHLDSGDCFQGAIIFNEYQGEAEVRGMTATGLDAAVIANHEFDSGAHNLFAQIVGHGGYDLLAANYDFESSTLPWSNELERVALPSKIYELDGLRVGVIGLGNLSSLNSIHDEDNSLGITVRDEYEVVPQEAALLRAQGADIVLTLSHMGLDDDLEMAAEVSDIDLVIGGHHHVAIDPPLVVTNRHTGKRIPVVHSGAFAKFIGRLDLVVRDGQLMSHDYTLFPISSETVSGEDPEVHEILLEYQDDLDQRYRLDQVIGVATQRLTRYGTTGGDSMLGNCSAEAMRSYPGVETEIAVTNTLGIRSDIGATLEEGETWDITVDDLFNSMPFDNTITTMFLSGREVQELLDYVAWRSSERGCNSQAQVAGIRFTMNCRDRIAEDIFINGVPLDPNGTYELATNNYIAHGGSGFSMLERNTTQFDTGVSIRDVVKAYFIDQYELPGDSACVEDGRILPVF